MHSGAVPIIVFVEIVANGTAFSVDEPLTIEEFVRVRGLDPRFVIVERNGEPVARSDYPAVVLAEGDRLELVRAVAGG